MAASRRRKRKRKQPEVAAEPNTEKRPRLPFHPEANKVPVAVNRRDFGRYYPRWRFGLLQMDGAFGWYGLEPASAHSLRERLAQLERQTWNEIFVQDRHHHHSADLDKLSSAALKRLRELKLDDRDCLWSLRVSARERVWGILEEDIFYFLWWDPEHEVYPSSLKHT